MPSGNLTVIRNSTVTPKTRPKMRRYRNVVTSRPKRRAGGRGISSAFPTYKGASPFPPHKVYKLRYQNTHVVTVGTSGVLGSIVKYNLNNLYDPDQTGAGHQPYGFDQLAGIYNRYKVIGAKVEFVLTDPTEDAIAFIYTVTNPSNESETIAGLNPDAAAEKQMSGKLRLNATGNQYLKKSFYMPIALAAGLTKLQFKTDVDNFTAATSGAPGSKVQLQFATANERSLSTGSLLCSINITYYALFYQRKVMSQS